MKSFPWKNCVTFSIEFVAHKYPSIRVRTSWNTNERANICIQSSAPTQTEERMYAVDVVSVRHRTSFIPIFSTSHAPFSCTQRACSVFFSRSSHATSNPLISSVWNPTCMRTAHILSHHGLNRVCTIENVRKVSLFFPLLYFHLHTETKTNGICFQFQCASISIENLLQHK